MANNVFNSQLDAFDQHHKNRENNEVAADASTGGPALPALGHAIAGSVGSAVSNIVTYPLALVVTRLQIQRQSRGVKAEQGENGYKSGYDALLGIYRRDGPSGLYQGVDAATVKTMADSFLFFLSYNSLRYSKIYISAPGSSSAIEELKIGFLAGAFAKLLTTPISNVVTRKQVSSKQSLTHDENSISTIARLIYRERGLKGFWSGYSASLILTLNPSLTFYFFDIFKKLLLPRSQRAKPSPRATFVLAALSKAMASTITYPFSLAKTRMQVSKPSHTQIGDEKRPNSARTSNIFSVILQIIQQEGVTGLYDGVQGEVVKGFLSHGITMLTKDLVHGIVIRLYYIILKLLRRYPSPTKVTSTAAQKVLATAEKAAQSLSEQVPKRLQSSH